MKIIICSYQYKPSFSTHNSFQSFPQYHVLIQSIRRHAFPHTSKIVLLETSSTHTLIKIFSRYFAGTGYIVSADTWRKEYKSRTCNGWGSLLVYHCEVCDHIQLQVDFKVLYIGMENSVIFTCFVGGFVNCVALGVECGVMN
jgi:hypothetical protein